MALVCAPFHQVHVRASNVHRAGTQVHQLEFLFGGQEGTGNNTRQRERRLTYKMKGKLVRVRAAYMDRRLFLSHGKTSQRRIAQTWNRGSTGALETQRLLGFCPIIRDAGVPLPWSPRGPRWLLEPPQPRPRSRPAAERKGPRANTAPRRLRPL